VSALEALAGFLEVVPGAVLAEDAVARRVEHGSGEEYGAAIAREVGEIGGGSWLLGGGGAQGQRLARVRALRLSSHGALHGTGVIGLCVSSVSSARGAGGARGARGEGERVRVGKR